MVPSLSSGSAYMANTGCMIIYWNSSFDELIISERGYNYYGTGEHILTAHSSSAFVHVGLFVINVGFTSNLWQQRYCKNSYMMANSMLTAEHLRYLGNSCTVVSNIGLGTMTFGHNEVRFVNDLKPRVYLVFKGILHHTA